MADLRVKAYGTAAAILALDRLTKLWIEREYRSRRAVRFHAEINHGLGITNIDRKSVV